MARFNSVWSLVVHGFLPFTTANAIPSNTTPSSHWGSCPPTLGLPSLLKCMNITVPLDYDKPSGEQIGLMIMKLPANNTAERKGSLVYQHGGPGDVTWTVLNDTASGGLDRFGDLRNYFDIVVAEPRGIAYNHPVLCDPQSFTERLNSFPTTEKEWNALVDAYGKLGQSCLKLTGKVLEFMDTKTQARDLEAFRIANGEGGLNYYGLSWGSLRGSQYAQLYPRNIRAMILDGVVDHSLDTNQNTFSQTVGLGLAQRKWLDWAGNNASSPLHGRNVVKLYNDLIKRASKTPIPAPGTKAGYATASDIRGYFFDPPNYPYNWVADTAVLKEVLDNNNASAIVPDGPPGPVYQSVTYSQLGIGCNDWPYKQSWNDFRQEEWLNSAYSIGPQINWNFMNTGCRKWPTARNSNPPGPLCVENPSAPILLVNALWDPAVGYDQALNVHRHIEKSVLLTRHGEGHGSWAFAYPETLTAMKEYLKDVKVPTKLLTDAPRSEVNTDFEILGWSKEYFNNAM